MNARHYDPSTGRFLSQDTYSGNAYEPWTQHLYSYTSNNPVNFVDPTGHAWIIDSNSRGEIQTIASAANPTKKIQYRKPISKSSSKTTAKKSTSIKKVAKAATKAGRTVIDFSNGVGAGVAESVTLGASSSLDSYWGRENEGVYISGKIVGNGIMAIAGGIGAGAIVTSPTGVGEVAFSGAAVASVGVSASAVACYTHNANVLFSMSGDKSAGSPDINYPGGDPAVSPGEGWEWRGGGEVGSSEGSWYNPKTKESLHPDLNHPGPIGSHWDYNFKGSGHGGWRIYPDGRMELK